MFNRQVKIIVLILTLIAAGVTLARDGSCPLGWWRGRDSCYYISSLQPQTSTITLDWFSAQAFCQATHPGGQGALVGLNDTEIEQVLSHNNNISHLWHWVAHDGSSIPSVTGKCPALAASNRSVILCQTQLPFLCQGEITQDNGSYSMCTGDSALRDRRVGGVYERYCYLWLPVLASASQADEICQYLGRSHNLTSPPRLASLHSPLDSMLIIDTMINYCQTSPSFCPHTIASVDTWIGLSMSKSSTSWRDGSEVTYKARHFLSNTSGECTVMRMGSVWALSPCEKRNYFACGVTVERTCDAGYSWSPEGTCVMCPEHSHKPAPGNHSCTPCPPGMNTMGEGAESCECDVTYGYIKENRSCAVCNTSDMGGIKLSVGNHSCVACPLGSVALLHTECVCNEGYERVGMISAHPPLPLCQPCPTGYYISKHPSNESYCEKCSMLHTTKGPGTNRCFINWPLLLIATYTSILVGIIVILSLIIVCMVKKFKLSDMRHTDNAHSQKYTASLTTDKGTGTDSTSSNGDIP